MRQKVASQSSSQLPAPIKRFIIPHRLPAGSAACGEGASMFDYGHRRFTDVFYISVMRRAAGRPLSTASRTADSSADGVNGFWTSGAS